MQYVTDGRFKFIWLPRIDVEQFFDLERDHPERQDEVAQWRGHLVRELAARGCGWAREGALVTPPDEPLVSPYKDARWPGGRRSE